MSTSLGLKVYQLISKFARKQAMRSNTQGIMQIPSQEVVRDMSNEILTKFMRHNVPTEMLTTERDIQKILNQIDIIETENLRRRTISPGDPRHKEITEKILGKKKTTADLIDLGLVRKGKNVKKTTPKEPVDPKLVEEVKVKETFDDFNVRQNQTDIVADTVTRVISMEPVAALKEANKIIGRKGIYKNLTKEQSQKILKDTEDWIFQRDPDDLYDYNKKRPFRDDADPEDFAQGGRSGLSYLLAEDSNQRVPYKTGKRVIEEMIATGPQTSGLSTIDKILNVTGTGVGISTLGLPKWLLSKIFEKTLQGKVRKKFFNEYKDERMGEARQMLTAQDPYVGEEPWLSRRKEKYRQAALRTPWSNDPELPTSLADGGRIGLKDGHSPGRRKFLKVAAGLATLPVVGKFFKWAKPLAKTAKIADVTSVPINNVAGMPAWFKPLVNKVIKEGEDVTKKFSTMDREIVHAAELPGSKTKVLVSQDITTGNVSVDIGYGKHGFADGHLGQPVRLEYKASEVIEPSFTKNKETIGKAGKTKEEFWVEEAEFTGGHPENVKFEESSFNKFGEHGSNFDEVEKFATGKVKKSKPTKKAERTEYESGKAESDAERWADEYEMQKNEGYLDEAEKDFYEGKASGGRVPFIFGGGAIKNVFKRLKDLRKMPRTEKMMKPNPKIQHLFTKADKVELSALKLEHAEAMLDMLKADRQLFVQFQSNRAMKDEGMDFLMKKMLEPMAPHINQYKSLKEIDEAILNMEMIVTNKTLKEGRQLNATGGLAGMLGE